METMLFNRILISLIRYRNTHDWRTICSALKTLTLKEVYRFSVSEIDNNIAFMAYLRLICQFEMSLDGEVLIFKKEPIAMMLMELFDTPNPILQWVKEIDTEYAEFEIDGRLYTITIHDDKFPNFNVKHVDFSHNGSTEATNFGINQFKILGSVLNAAIDRIKMLGADVVYFAAKDHDQSFGVISRVYSSIMKQISRKEDLHFAEISQKSENIFILSRDAHILKIVSDFLIVKS